MIYLDMAVEPCRHKTILKRAIYVSCHEDMHFFICEKRKHLFRCLDSIIISLVSISAAAPTGLYPGLGQKPQRRQDSYDPCFRSRKEKRCHQDFRSSWAQPMLCSF